MDNLQCANRELQASCTIAIIGAGISGLSAARDLVRAGVDVCVLEARDRVGGRLLSVRSSGGTLDLGATWFWEGERHVEKLLQELSVPTHQQYRDGVSILLDDDGAGRMSGNPVDFPAGRFSQGAQAIAERLAALLPDGTVQLGVVVEAIVVSGETVQLKCANGHVLTADQVVVTLPPALAVSTITFAPELPEQFINIARETPIWMGAITKVVAEYSSPFWRAKGLAGSGVSDVGRIREVHDMSGPNGSPAALFGFTIATRESTITEAEVVQQLVSMFGSDAGEPLSVHILDWRAERFTSTRDVWRGNAYHLYGHEQFRRPSLSGRVHWASTETATTNPGHIDGALSSAKRVVELILDQKPQL